MQLSEHFGLQEFTKSSHSDIPNGPSPEEIACLKALCLNILEPLRAHYGKPITILSGFRCPALNKVVGGAPTSQHVMGQAADIEIYGIRNDEIWQYIVNSLPFDQVIAEKLSREDGSAGWVHVSYDPRARRDAISFLGNGVYGKGLQYPS